MDSPLTAEMANIQQISRRIIGWHLRKFFDSVEERNRNRLPP
jgi:hypothetical protein